MYGGKGSAGASDIFPKCYILSCTSGGNQHWPVHAIDSSSRVCTDGSLTEGVASTYRASGASGCAWMEGSSVLLELQHVRTKSEVYSMGVLGKHGAYFTNVDGLPHGLFEYLTCQFEKLWDSTSTRSLHEALKHIRSRPKVRTLNWQCKLSTCAVSRIMTTLHYLRKLPRSSERLAMVSCICYFDPSL